MSKVVYPGSFDPITLGHIDIIRRIVANLGRITVLISQNPSKSHLFTVEERVDLARKALRGIQGVDVDWHEGLTVDYLRERRASVIVRGLRAVSDFEYEFVMANMNKKLAPDIETMIVFASPEFYYVSSKTVKEVALNGGSVKSLVPSVVEKALNRKYQDKLRDRKLAELAEKNSQKASRAKKKKLSSRK